LDTGIHKLVFFKPMRSGNVKGFSSFPPFAGDAACLHAVVKVEAIADLCRIMELYEGVAFIRTRDPDRGIVEFWVSPFFLEDFRQIFEALKKDVPMELISEGD